MEAAQSTLNQEPQAVVVRKESERDLITWTAPARPFKRRDRQFYVTTFAMAGVVSLIVFFAEGIMPVLLIVSLVFLYYVLSTTEPGNVEYKITNRGIKIGSKLNPWQSCIRFWFAKRLDNEVFVVETVVIPGQFEVVLDPAVKESVKKEVSAFIPYEEKPASGIDKATSWIAEKLPGNS